MTKLLTRRDGSVIEVSDELFDYMKRVVQAISAIGPASEKVSAELKKLNQSMQESEK